jgi:hypothetical protein
MNCEKTIKVGDVVKSLDFVNMENCYYIGHVVSISEMDGTFRAKTIKRVWMGLTDRKEKSDFFTAPLPGNMLLDEWDSSLNKKAKSLTCIRSMV